MRNAIAGGPIGSRRALAAMLCALIVSCATASAAFFGSSNSTSLEPGATGGVSAICFPGQQARRGGFTARFGADGGAELTAFKRHGRGWRVLATNTSPHEEGLVIVESYCKTSTHRRLAVRSTTAAVPPRTAVRVVARCRRGETLLAAGFRNSIDPETGSHVVVDGMRRIAVRNLQVRAVNLSATASGTATAYAYCGHAPRPFAVRETVTVPPSGKARLAVACSRHHGEHRLVFAGFQASQPRAAEGTAVSPSQFRIFMPDKVVATAVNRSSTHTEQMTVFAYCR